MCKCITFLLEAGIQRIFKEELPDIGTAASVQKIFKEVCPDVTDNDISELLDAAPKDDNGLITYADFINWLFSAEEVPS